jgi:hypothetical protein
MKGKNALLCSYVVGFTKDNQFWFFNYFSISKLTVANFLKKIRIKEPTVPAISKTEGFHERTDNEHTVSWLVRASPGAGTICSSIHVYHIQGIDGLTLNPMH